MTKSILVTGARGQVGTELVSALRKSYGSGNVIATDVSGPVNRELLDTGPFHMLDCTDLRQFGELLTNVELGTIYHLAAILSAKGEANPMLAWKVNMQGLCNCLEVARERNCALFTPSSIAAFGPGTPLNRTPQVTVQRPNTVYGIAKMTGELLCNYYYYKFGVDARGLRWPGIISHVALPGGGVTDYAIEIFYEAVKHKRYEGCFIKENTTLDMMYMPDAIKSAMSVMEKERRQLQHCNAYNITAMNFSPRDLAIEIKKHIPEFTIDYRIDMTRQRIAESWPRSIDDSAAKEEWGWKPDWDLSSMTKDMLKNLSIKLKDNMEAHTKCH